MFSINNKYTFIILILLTFCLTGISSAQETGAKYYTLDAENIGYHNNIVSASGNVIFKSEGLIVKTDKISINITENKLTTLSNEFLIIMDNRKIKGERLLYDYQKKTGKFFNAETKIDELNFKGEMANIIRFRSDFEDNPYITAPEVYSELSTVNVLVMEEIKGSKLRDVDQNHPHNKFIAELGAKALMQQVLINGFFHADPHPGNIFITGEKTIAYVDFGMVGRITEEDRDLMALLFYALINKRINVLMDVILILGNKPDNFNRRRFQLDMEKILDRYYGSDLSNIEIKAVFEDLQYFIYEHQIRMPQDFFLLFRAIAVSEGVGQDLDPDFNVVEVGRDFISDILDDRMQLDKIISRLGSEIWKFGRKKHELNNQLKSILDKLVKDDFTINFRHTNLENLISRIDIISNRLSMSMIIASLIIGSTLLIQTNMEPRIFNIPLLGFIGYSFAGLLGLLLVISIFRSGKY